MSTLLRSSRWASTSKSEWGFANAHMLGANAAGYYDLASDQLDIVSDVSNDVETKLSATLASYLIASKEKSIKDIDVSLSAPLKEAAAAYAEVVKGIDFPQVARERLVRAQQLERDIPITILESGIRTSSITADDLAHQGKGPDGQAFNPDNSAAVGRDRGSLAKPR
jgi:hypothetical protein